MRIKAADVEVDLEVEVDDAEALHEFGERVMQELLKLEGVLAVTDSSVGTDAAAGVVTISLRACGPTPLREALAAVRVAGRALSH